MMAETYRGTYNPDKKRGELLKDNMATGDYYSDLKAAERAAKQKNATEKAKEDGGRTQYIDRKMPAGTGKDILMGVSRVLDKMGVRQDKTYAGKSDEEIAKKGEPVKKAKGGKVSASKRGDGCAQRGFTKGRIR